MRCLDEAYSCEEKDGAQDSPYDQGFISILTTAVKEEVSRIDKSGNSKHGKDDAESSFYVHDEVSWKVAKLLP